MKCFVKAERMEVGRGFYWTIDKQFIDAFEKGDFNVDGAKERKKSSAMRKQKKRTFSSHRCDDQSFDVRQYPPQPAEYGSQMMQQFQPHYVSSDMQLTSDFRQQSLLQEPQHCGFFKNIKRYSYREGTKGCVTTTDETW
ncbi:uncharacterized protein [Watersipora subatra]|uniref:uncharacterized protein n=1 Tax=Watersipora subatra TaxID=2589382 RepID=UPI00355B611D